MNSVAIINWEDREFKERVSYSLEKTGYAMTEDYLQHGVRIQVWTCPTRASGSEGVWKNSYG